MSSYSTLSGRFDRPFSCSIISLFHCANNSIKILLGHSLESFIKVLMSGAEYFCQCTLTCKYFHIFILYSLSCIVLVQYFRIVFHSLISEIKFLRGIPHKHIKEIVRILTEMQSNERHQNMLITVEIRMNNLKNPECNFLRSKLDFCIPRSPSSTLNHE
ncbi:unnamed protein product [Moneuplotes crassus]|uniref:Uncharacterized protein n=1 Tax=Euplotes crassus TaxID=5936 RepID=A0AAD1U732_EUPCR|nr:unnamed protein product [Moneuplotes crassus]